MTDTTWLQQTAVSNKADPRNILVVEDTPSDLVLLEVALQEAATFAYKLTTATTLKQCLKLLWQNIYDAILLDLGLPDSEGMEGLKTIIEHHRNIAVIVLTGHEDETVIEQALALGAQDYLIKNQFDSSILSRAIRYAIERKRLESERNTLERDILQNQKMDALGNLASIIAHDLNNMLTPILMSSELGILWPDKVEQHNQLFKEIRDSTLNAQDLVKQILTFCYKQPKFLPQYLDLKTVLTQALKLAFKTLPATIETTETIDEDCGTILGDSTEIQQAIINLCINAYQAIGSENAGQIWVTARQIELKSIQIPRGCKAPPGQFALISIKDNGKGISQNTRKHIFEPFFTTKKPGSGTGLGLSASQSIVNRHNGFIALSPAEEQGTEFVIYLPLVPQEHLSTSDESAVQVPRGNSHILLVEDNRKIRDTLENALVSLGYTVQPVDDAQNAIDRWQDDFSEFDLIITDQDMPQLTGLQFTQAVREAGYTAPIIMTTGFSQTLTPETVLEAGANALLIKPLSLEKLAKTLQELL